VLAPADDPILGDTVLSSTADLAGYVAAEFALVGLNGIDFIVRDGIPYALEINPRWSASMELVERAYGVSMFGIHAAACVNGVLPSFDLKQARRRKRTMGKAIAFARGALTAGATHRFLDDEMVSDIPRPGDRIAAGQPICTVFEEDTDVERCRAGLRRRAQSIISAITVMAVLALSAAHASAQQIAGSDRTRRDSVFSLPADARLQEPVARQTQSGSRPRSVRRKVFGAIAGGVGGFFAGGFLGAAIEGDRCHCDDPGLMGALIGAPVGAAAGSILGYKFLF
jgi:hypothetical protein